MPVYPLPPTPAAYLVRAGQSPEKLEPGLNSPAATSLTVSVVNRSAISVICKIEEKSLADISLICRVEENSLADITVICRVKENNLADITVICRVEENSLADITVICRVKENNLADITVICRVKENNLAENASVIQEHRTTKTPTQAYGRHFFLNPD